MQKLYKQADFNSVILVSGDGDYKHMVDFLIAEGRFEKILFPDKHGASSLYSSLAPRYYAKLDDAGTRKKISRKDKAGSA